MLAKARKDHSKPLEGVEFELVSSAKVLGVCISSDLKWSAHIDSITTKAAKRLYLLRQLKRAGIAHSVLIRFYCSVIRSILNMQARSSIVIYRYISRKKLNAFSVVCYVLQLALQLCMIEGVCYVRNSSWTLIRKGTMNSVTFCQYVLSRITAIL